METGDKRRSANDSIPDRKEMNPSFGAWEKKENHGVMAQPGSSPCLHFRLDVVTSHVEERQVGALQSTS